MKIGLCQYLELNDLEIREINIADRSSRADLVFEFESSSQNISGELIYNCSLYKAQTCNRLIAGLIKSLELLVKSCGKKQNEFIESLKNEDVFEELKRV